MRAIYSTAMPSPRFWGDGQREGLGLLGPLEAAQLMGLIDLPIRILACRVALRVCGPYSTSHAFARFWETAA